MATDDESSAKPASPNSQTTSASGLLEYGYAPAGCAELITSVVHVPTPDGIQVEPTSSEPAEKK